MRPGKQGTDMTSSAHSEYIRYDQKSALIRRWIATILLKSDLEGYLAFNGLEPIITRGFDTSSVNKENREDAPFIRAWLKEEHAKCGKESFDEADVFAINTRRIQKSMGLNKVELAVLRFACLVNCYKPLEAATEFGGNCFAEADLCGMGITRRSMSPVGFAFPTWWRVRFSAPRMRTTC